MKQYSGGLGLSSAHCLKHTIKPIIVCIFAFACLKNSNCALIRLTERSQLGCIPVGSNFSYQCTVMDQAVGPISGTVWLGSAFVCPEDSNQISLQHAQYSRPGGAMGDCGGLSAMSSSSGNGNYTSTLSFTATADMDGLMINCTLGISVTVGSDVIRTGDPPSAPEFMNISFSGSSYIISWSTPGDGSNINGSSFTVSGSECGCRNETLSSSDTSVTCSGWEANGQTCSFTVRTESRDCALSSEPATLSIRLSVPDSPTNVRLLPAIPVFNEYVSISVQFFSVEEPPIGGNLNTTVWYTVNASGVLYRVECFAMSLCIFNFTTIFTNEFNVSVIASNMIGSSPPTYYMECSPDDLGTVHSNLSSDQPGVINVTGGLVMISSLAPESAATLRCDEGFKPESATNRTCQFNGQWSDETLNCIAKVSQPCPSCDIIIPIAAVVGLTMLLLILACIIVAIYILKIRFCHSKGSMKVDPYGEGTKTTNTDGTGVFISTKESKLDDKPNPQVDTYADPLDMVEPSEKSKIVGPTHVAKPTNTTTKDEQPTAEECLPYETIEVAPSSEAERPKPELYSEVFNAHTGGKSLKIKSKGASE